MTSETIHENLQYPMLQVSVTLIADIPELSILTRNALLRKGFVTSVDLFNLSLKDLHRFDRIGKTGRNAIVNYFNKMGVAFNEKDYFLRRNYYDLL